MTFERDSSGQPITVGLAVQGTLNRRTGVITSTIKFDPNRTIGFGHTHPLNGEPGIGPLDDVGPKQTGLPSFVRGSTLRIFLIENVEGTISVIPLN